MRISQAFAAWENTLAGRFGGNWQIVQEGVATPLGRDRFNDFERGPTPQITRREPHHNLKNVRAFVFSMVLSPIAPAFSRAM